MSFNVIDQYNSFVENNFIKSNDLQLDVLKKIDTIWNNNKKTNLFSKSNKKNGVYLYGGVGTGKTFLLNLFYQNTKVGTKIHFNNLMIQIHKAVKDSSTKDDAIEDYIKDLGQKFKLLFRRRN